MHFVSTNLFVVFLSKLMVQQTFVRRDSLISVNKSDGSVVRRVRHWSIVCTRQRAPTSKTPESWDHACLGSGFFSTTPFHGQLPQASTMASSSQRLTERDNALLRLNLASGVGLEHLYLHQDLAPGQPCAIVLRESAKLDHLKTFSLSHFTAEEKIGRASCRERV